MFKGTETPGQRLPGKARPGLTGKTETFTEQRKHFRAEKIAQTKEKSW